DDVLSRPSVAVGAAKFGDRVPIGDVEDRLFVLALEEEDILFLLIQADPLKLQLGDLKLLATRGQIGSLQVRRWKRFTAGDHQILLSWSRPEFGRSPDGPDQGGRVASKAQAIGFVLVRLVGEDHCASATIRRSASLSRARLVAPEDMSATADDFD